MSTPASTQDPAARITYLDDWSAHLKRANRTITAATVTADNGAVCSSVTALPHGVMFRLTTAGVPTPPASVTVTVQVDLDNGDDDYRRHIIRVART